MGIWCLKIIISVLHGCFIKTLCGDNKILFLFLLVKATYLPYFPLWESSVKIQGLTLSVKPILYKRCTFLIRAIRISGAKINRILSFDFI